MKIGHLLLPSLAQAQDDTSTLLSLKVHTALEAGVDHLLDAVGSRNVTQMSSLLQNLVEESISDGLGELDGDVKTALGLIKAELLGDIRNSLKEAHCSSQVSLHESILHFEKCEEAKKIGYASCDAPCDGMKHKKCREHLFGHYEDHIKKCRTLDIFTLTAIDPCPEFDKGCCVLPHTTWNCEGPCKNTIKKLKVDDRMGHWLKKQIDIFNSTHTAWEGLYKECKDSYRTYVEKDAECDCLQAECEATNCEYDSCRWKVCDDDYQKCWGAAEEAMCRRVPVEQCLEKDRKIDWSATEKIECYVDVLMKNPTKQELMDDCGSPDCINTFRENMYKKCNNICREVDFEQVDGIPNFPKWGSTSYDTCSSTGKFTGNDYQCIDVIADLIAQMNVSKRRAGDEDVTKEGIMGVSTRHRGDGEDRCTAHLDIDWQAPPCCTACEENPSPPCEGAGDYSGGWDKTKYMWLHYGQYNFMDDSQIDEFDHKKCYEEQGEHTYMYAYNLCECNECSPHPTPPCPNCVERKFCQNLNAGEPYDYSKHYAARDANCDHDDDKRVGYEKIPGFKKAEDVDED